MEKNNENKKTVSRKAAEVNVAEPDAGKKRARKKLAEMDLLDDFLFGSMVAYPNIGERFVRILLKTIFGREFGRLSITAQKVLYGTDTDLRGARLDVYLEPEIEENAEERATVYDLEPDRRDNVADKKALPRRVRFYHAKVVARDLSAGAEYDELKNVVIVMIMPYDPFGLNRMVYTVKNKCVEAPEMPYEDGASTLFLYTEGIEGVPNEEVKQMLHYLGETTFENAVNEDLREIHEMVGVVRRDPETSLAYWKMMEKINRSTAKGRAEGRAEGMAEGELRKLIALVCKKIKKNQSIEKIAEDLVEEISVVESIYNTAKEFAPDYNPELVFGQISAGKVNDVTE